MTQHYLLMDIETLPTIDPVKIAEIDGGLTHPANMTKLDTIETWKIDKRPTALKDLIAKTSLDGSYGRLASLAFAIDNGLIQSAAAHEEGVSDEQAERSMLQRFVDVLNRTFSSQSPIVVGHNVGDFDLRFVWKRAIVLGIPMPAWWPVEARAWDRSRIYDTMIAWEGVGNRISQRRLARILGIEVTPGIDGSEVAQAWSDGRYDEVLRHNIDDVRVVREIWRRIAGVPVPVEVAEEVEAELPPLLAPNAPPAPAMGFRPAARTVVAESVA